MHPPLSSLCVFFWTGEIFLFIVLLYITTLYSCGKRGIMSLRFSRWTGVNFHQFIYTGHFTNFRANVSTVWFIHSSTLILKYPVYSQHYDFIENNAKKSSFYPYYFDRACLVLFILWQSWQILLNFLVSMWWTPCCSWPICLCTHIQTRVCL